MRQVLLLVVVAGLVLGWVFPNPKLKFPLNVAQSATGWMYVGAWSLSFYPQVILNWRRKSVTGLSFDFLALNLLGWVAYSTFNVSIYMKFECPPAWPKAGQAAAAAATKPLGAIGTPHARNSLVLPGLGPPGVAGSVFAALDSGANPAALGSWAADDGRGGGSGGGSGPTGFCQYAVELNDVVFSIHALVLTLCTLIQCMVYPRGKQRVHGVVKAGIFLSAASALGYAAAIAAAWSPPGLLAPLGRWLQWVYWLYYLSFIKMGVTLVKYLPQVWYNCKRRSTQGWSLLNVLLDAMGGVLSMGQQLVTCWWARDWSPITTNPVKLGLAVTSLLMDAVFVAQHAAYRHRRPGPCPMALRRVRSLLRALSRAPERLPPDVAEDLLLSLSDHGFDVDVPSVLLYYAEHPQELGDEALAHLLDAYWRVGGAVGISRGVCSAGSLPALAAGQPPWDEGGSMRGGGGYPSYSGGGGSADGGGGGSVHGGSFTGMGGGGPLGPSGSFPGAGGYFPRTGGGLPTGSSAGGFSGPGSLPASSYFENRFAAARGMAAARDGGGGGADGGGGGGGSGSRGALLLPGDDDAREPLLAVDWFRQRMGSRDGSHTPSGGSPAAAAAAVARAAWLADAAAAAAGLGEDATPRATLRALTMPGYAVPKAGGEVAALAAELEPDGDDAAPAVAVAAADEPAAPAGGSGTSSSGLEASRQGPSEAAAGGSSSTATSGAATSGRRGARRRGGSRAPGRSGASAAGGAASAGESGSEDRGA